MKGGIFPIDRNDNHALLVHFYLPVTWMGDKLFYLGLSGLLCTNLFGIRGFMHSSPVPSDLGASVYLIILHPSPEDSYEIRNS